VRTGPTFRNCLRKYNLIPKAPKYYIPRSKSECRFLAKFRNIDSSNYTSGTQGGARSTTSEGSQSSSGISGCTISGPIFGSGALLRTSPTYRNRSKNLGKSNLMSESLPSDSETSKPPLQLYFRAQADKLRLELLPPKVLGPVPECQTSFHHRNRTAIEAQFMCQI
jgi:hypothetical protein